MKAIILLQARTNSSRLPAKVLLPVAGLPLVVLAARRAGNTGHDVRVVTSQEPSDDTLCHVLADLDVDCFRGELENALKRFVDALANADDEQVIVRLTGDNVFPDGAFIDDMLDDFKQRSLDYLCCVGEETGLPYGVSAEITRVGLLRQAQQQTESQFDREHVTPWVIRHYGRTGFERYRAVDMSRYRCTVDTLDDYLLVSRVFADVDDPEQIGLAALLEKLKQADTRVITENPASRMVLGTVQFGLDYGIANSQGRPEQPQVNKIVRTAIANGVPYLDTARAYGDSEQALGRALAGGWQSRVMTLTKLAPLDDCPADADVSVAGAFVERSVYQSCHALGVSRLDGLMLHRASHLSAWQGAAWNRLRQLQQAGVIGELGVSVQSPEEALMALEVKDVKIIQLPFNILDHRWRSVIERVGKVRETRSMTIHARSALLQGLLTSTDEVLWERAQCATPPLIIDWLQEKAQEYASGDVIELCLRYVFSQSWIDGVVVGVETPEQIQQNLTVATKALFDADQLNAILRGRPTLGEQTLNPANWNPANGKRV